MIEWSGMTVNHFAYEIGLNRAENLYHIKKGNYGISLELANRIVARFPEIDLTWLLSGVGGMLIEEKSNVKTLPYFRQDIAQVLINIDHLTPTETINFPYFVDCSCVVRSLDRAMNEPLAVASDLFLREVDIVDVIQGNENLQPFAKLIASIVGPKAANKFLANTGIKRKIEAQKLLSISLDGSVG